MPEVIVRQKDLDAILVEARKKVEGIRSLVTPYNKEQLAKAIFVISGKDFIKHTHLIAVSNPKAFHHIYEWNKVGKENARLFKLIRSRVSGGRLLIKTDFTRSNSLVPISKQLTVPGKTGKVVKSKYIFKDKASVMESGKPVRITAKVSNYLAFPSNDGPKFIKKPQSVTIKNPGGVQVKNSFTKLVKEWFKDPVNIEKSLASCGMLVKIERELAKELNRTGAGKERASYVIKKITDSYSKGIDVL